MPKSRCAGGSAETSRPFWRIVPEVCGSRPAMARSKRGLAAARGPEEADELALGDVERDVAEGGEVAEALGEVADFEVARHLRARLT